MTPSTSTSTTSSSSQTTKVRQSSTKTEAVARSVTSPIVICHVPHLTTKFKGTAETSADQAEQKDDPPHNKSSMQPKKGRRAGTEEEQTPSKADHWSSRALGAGAETA